MTTEITIIIIAIIYIIGAFTSYKLIFSNWQNSKFEKVWFSALWPLIIPLYIIHWIHIHM